MRRPTDITPACALCGVVPRALCVCLLSVTLPLCLSAPSFQVDIGNGCDDGFVQGRFQGFGKTKRIRTGALAGARDQNRRRHLQLPKQTARGPAPACFVNFVFGSIVIHQLNVIVAFSVCFLSLPN